MNNIKALEDLRELATGSHSYISNGRVLESVDEIEREVSERFMELPVDADGVPIRLGDKITLTDKPQRRVFIVSAVGATKSGNPVFHGYEENGDHLERHRVGVNTKHAKPRTVEDVLTDFANEVARQGHQIGLTGHELTMRYADEIRKVLGANE